MTRCLALSITLVHRSTNSGEAVARAIWTRALYAASCAINKIVFQINEVTLLN